MPCARVSVDPRSAYESLRARRTVEAARLERLDAAIRWVTEQGYKPVFFHEGFLGGPE